MSIDWDNVGNWCGIVGYSLMLIGVVLYMVFLAGSCSTLSDFERRAEVPEVATACDYKLAIIWRGQFRPGEQGEKDFFNSVTAQIKWFWKRNYTVFKVKYEHGFTVTHKEVVRCGVIFYRKNE